MDSRVCLAHMGSFFPLKMAKSTQTRWHFDDVHERETKLKKKKEMMG